MNVLVLLWHLSREREITSGGLKRFVEVVSRGKNYSIKFTLIENSPPLKLSVNKSHYETIHFRVPLEKFEDSMLFRFFVWIFFMVQATIHGIKVTSREHFDIIMTPSAELLCNAFPAFLVHILRGIPLVYVVQLTPSGFPYSGFFTEYRRYRKQGFNQVISLALVFYIYINFILLLKLYNKSNIIIVVSEYLKKQLKSYGVKQPIFVVKNGINVENVTHEGSKVYDAVFVGRHSPQKGIIDALEAWRLIVKKVPGATLVLIGYCTEDMKKLIEKRIKEYGLEKNILIKGVLPRRDLFLTMKKSKFLLFPSYEESFGLVVGEALACGLPVVCYEIPAIREIYRTDAVLSCPVGNVKCLAKKSLELLFNEKLLRELSARGQKYVRMFNWDDTARQEFILYYRLLRGIIS
jgi:glycosyltransferase involved in cell wall biosynthesis